MSRSIQSRAVAVLTSLSLIAGAGGFGSLALAAPDGPTVVLASTSASITNAASIPVTVTFSESVTGFTSSSVAVTNATVADFSGSGADYSFSLVPTADGTVTVEVNADVANSTDSSIGNQASNVLTFTSNTGDVGTIQVNSVVINDDGGTRTPESFDLFVRLSTDESGTLVTSGEANAFDAPATYQVSATGDGNYTQTRSGDCDLDGFMDLDVGDALVCTITNDDIAADGDGDTTPDAFTFIDETDVALSTIMESNAITVAGIDTAAGISVVGGEYSVNGGAYTSVAGTVDAGNTVSVRHTSSASNSTDVNTTLTIGGVSDTFTTTTTVSGDGPTISGVAVSGITTSGATITWDTDEGATGQVSYGTTASYGSSTTLVTSLDTSHTATLSGLDAGTLYHFQITSTDADENTTTTSDATFTTSEDSTPDTDAPVISDVSVSLTDTTATITWNTNGGATTQVFYGTTVDYDASSPFVTTLDTSHTVVLTGLDPETLYHYQVQSDDAAGNPAATPDATFTTNAADGDTGTIQVNKVVINDDGGTMDVADFPLFVTLSTESDGTHVVSGESNTFAASGTYRVTETGNENYAKTFSGDCDSDGFIELAPGQTKVCTITNNDIEGGDHDHDDDTAPVISNVVVSTTTSSATITWDTDEDATGQVFFGTTSSYGSSTPLVTTLGTSHTATLSGLDADTIYHFQIHAEDEAGNNATTTNATFSTGTTSIGAPVITNISTTMMGTTAAQITWNTDTAATSQVFYGTSASYGSSTPVTTSATTTHSVIINGLSEATLYHFQVAATNDGGTTLSADQVFTTNSSASTTPLMVTGIDSVNTTATADGTFEHGWKWVLHFVVPSDEDSLQLKFADFTSSSSSSTIPVAGNVRYYSTQSSNASTTSSAVVETDNDYGTALILTGDTSTTTPGRQIDVTVEMAVPTGTPTGVYSTIFGARSE